MGGFKFEDHKRLLQLLKSINGKFVLTTYYNELYDKELKNFHCITIETSISAVVKRSEQRRKGLEYVYMNFEPKQNNQILDQTQTLIDFNND